MDRNAMEQRRMEAAEKFTALTSPTKVARLFKVSRMTALRWRQTLEERGVDGLRRRKATGRPRRISKENILALYSQGPRAHGYSQDRWTPKPFKDTIYKVFGILYSRDHTSRLIQLCNSGQNSATQIN